jgi:hypothetical protein
LSPALFSITNFLIAFSTHEPPTNQHGDSGGMPTLSAILCGDFKRPSWIARTTQLLVYQSRYKQVDDVWKEPIRGRPEPNESGDLVRLLIFEMATGQGKTVPPPRISHFPLREGF